MHLLYVKYLEQDVYLFNHNESKCFNRKSFNFENIKNKGDLNVTWHI